MQWSPQQDAALRECARWLRCADQQVFYLAGYAGTGKTTLAKHLVASEAPGRWRFAAYTGKASHVLRQKGCYGASTIHSLIYRPAGESLAQELADIDCKIFELRTRKEEEIDVKRLELLHEIRRELTQSNRPHFTLWSGSPLADSGIDGVVIDEVSMVDQRLGNDLESFGKKILALGDPAQLPPVGAGGHYTLRKPDVMLTEVHRHAAESGILRLATLIREGGSIKNFESCSDVEIIEQPKINKADILKADQVLVGLNATRKYFNARTRIHLGMTDPGPMPGDRVVCLRNDRELGIFNGSQWKVLENNEIDLDDLTCDMTVQSEEELGHVVYISTWLHHMLNKGELLEELGFQRRDLQEFDWSYALTTHKAQGSQWESVVLFDQSYSFRADARKWLYTGITRAAKKLMVII